MVRTASYISTIASLLHFISIYPTNDQVLAAVQLDSLNTVLDYTHTHAESNFIVCTNQPVTNSGSYLCFYGLIQSITI